MTASNGKLDTCSTCELDTLHVTTGGYPRVLLPILLIAQLIIPMSIAGTAIALPSISDVLGAQPVALQWVVNGFNVAFALFTVIWGVASDWIGSRTVFRLGVTFALVAAFFSTISTSLLMLDVARVFAGIGSGAVVTGASVIISNAYKGVSRAKAFAAFGTINGLGLALGPLISGGLISGFGWRGVFAVQVVALAISLAGTLALPVISHQTHPDQKILDLSLLRNREFAAMVLVPIAGAVGFVPILTYLPSGLTAVLGLNAGTVGALMLAMSLPVLIAPLAAARLTTRYRRVRPIHVVLASLACLIVGDLGLLQVRPEVSIGSLIAPMVVTGLGLGLPLGLVDAHALAAVPARVSGTAAGVLNLFRIGGEAVFVAIYAAVLSISIHHKLPDPIVANRTAAGIPGHAEVYAGSLHPILIGMAVLVALISVGVIVLHYTAPGQGERS